MITNRNRTMMAPAYTMIWMAATNCAPSRRKASARAIWVATRNRAA
jgi:hypothetical protein